MAKVANTAFTHDNSLSLKSLVAKEIRHRIMTGQYALGQRLSENQLSQDFNTSRAPVHDALLTLRNEGLVEIIPQRGSFVFDPSMEEIHLMHEASCAYEVGALSLSLERAPQKLVKYLEKYLEQMKKAGDNHQKWTSADRDFHASIVHAADNEHLTKAYETINARTAVLIFHSTLSEERIETSLEQHSDIIQHIKKNDFNSAAKLLQLNNTGLEKFVIK